MFPADIMMVNSHDASLHRSERTFGRVRMYTVLRPLSRAVAYTFVPASIPQSDAPVSRILIRHTAGMGINLFPDCSS